MRIYAPKRLAVYYGVIALLALLLVVWGPGILPLVIFAGTISLAIRIAIGPLPRFIARRGFSIRWKILTAITLMAGLFFVVSLINFTAMDYMHQKVHEIQELRLVAPFQIPMALESLHQTQHGLLFSLTPLLSLLAALLALCLGIAVALSVINPLRKMQQAMGRIAAGDLSEKVQVENKDELGVLGASINATAAALGTLQEATLAEERARALHERITQVTLAQEEERRRISRELHDSLGPSLAAIGNRLRASQQTLWANPGKAEEDLEEVIHNLRGHIQGIRELIHDLRPMVLDQLGLVAAVRQQVERFGHDTGIQTSFTTSGAIELEPFAEVTVYRVIQECLGNVQKHAGAGQVEVHIGEEDEGIVISIADNGKGFDPLSPAHPSASGGLGLVSMQERAVLLKGSLTVHSSPGRGCRVSMSIPRNEANVGTYTSSVSR
ncbi:MAG: HAMP domain-containing protein [Chloroflexi bacterium]|nr:HAMP domain-containing protein [Chloroflexota bacterium]